MRIKIKSKDQIEIDQNGIWFMKDEKGEWKGLLWDQVKYVEKMSPSKINIPILRNIFSFATFLGLLFFFLAAIHNIWLFIFGIIVLLAFLFVKPFIRIHLTKGGFIDLVFDDLSLLKTVYNSVPEQKKLKLTEAVRDVLPKK